MFTFNVRLLDSSPNLSFGVFLPRLFENWLSSIVDLKLSLQSKNNINVELSIEVSEISDQSLYFTL